MALRIRVRLPDRRRQPRRRNTDARLDRAWPSDARSAADRPGPTQDPEADRRRRLLRAASVLFLSLVFVGSSLAAVFGESGLLDLRRRHREIEALQQEVARREVEVAKLEGYVKRLTTDPTAIERIAREDLGLVKPGEITFLLPREEPAAPEDPTQTPPAPPGPDLP